MVAADLHKFSFIDQRNEPHHEKEQSSKLAMQPCFRKVGQTHAEWQTFEKTENES